MIQWNPYIADTLRNKRSVLIIGVSAFQRYGLNAHMLKQSYSMPEKVSKRRVCKGRGGSRSTQLTHHFRRRFQRVAVRA